MSRFPFTEISWSQITEMGLKVLIKSLRLALHRIIRMGASPFSRVMRNLDFQANTNDFESHGNKCVEDIPHLSKIMFSFIVLHEEFFMISSRSPIGKRMTT